MTWNIDTNALVLAIIAIVPSTLTALYSRRTRRSVQLAGSDVTVSNFNKLVQSLYAHITFLENKEKKLQDKIEQMELEEERYRSEVELEKKQFIAQIDNLSKELNRLQEQISKAQETIAKQQKELVLSNNTVKRLTKELASFKETYEKIYTKRVIEAARKGEI